MSGSEYGYGRWVIALLIALCASACGENAKLRSSTEMRTALSDLASAQDIYYSANLTYSADPATIAALALPPGVTITIESADAHGWRASASHEQGIETCSASGRNDGTAGLATVEGPTCTPVGLSAGQLDVRGRKAVAVKPVVADVPSRAVNAAPTAVSVSAPIAVSVSAPTSLSIAAPAAEVTPTAQPAEGFSVLLPVVGTETESFGYPTQTIDRLAIRHLLMTRSYDALDRLLTAYGDSVRRDYRYEYRLFDAYGAFNVAFPPLEPFLNEWVRMRPKSAAALLARGAFYSGSAWDARGAKLASETSNEQFTRMGSFFRRSIVDLSAAHRLEPNSIVAYRYMIGIATAQGDIVASRQLLDSALKIQPLSFILRSGHMQNLLPRWGGSYEAMAKFAAESAPYATRNPRINALSGFVDWDKGRVAEGDGQNGDAIEAYQRAVGSADYWQFREERGTYYAGIDKHEEALEDLNAALLQYPQSDDILSERARSEYELGRHAFGEAKAAYFSQAFRDAIMAVALDPANAYYHRQLVFYRKNIPEYEPPRPE